MAAKLRGEIGDKAGQGRSLHELAFCMVRGKSANMTEEARKLFREAAALKRAAGDEKGAVVSESWLK